MSLSLTGGEYKGRPLKTPAPRPGARPTSGRVREALFSILSDNLVGADFLDLFACSGAVGLEAMSRGAEKVDWVESHPRTAALLRENVNHLIGRATAGSVHKMDALRFVEHAVQEAKTWDFVFLDPPFDMDYTVLWPSVGKLVAPEGRLIVQYPLRSPASWVKLADDCRSYGESGMAFFTFESLTTHTGMK